MLKSPSRIAFGIGALLASLLAFGCDDSGQTGQPAGTGGLSGSPSTAGVGGGPSDAAGGAPVATIETSLTLSGASPRPVSPQFFGQNYWSWVPAWGDAVSTVEAQTQALGLKLLRAGGANNDRQNPTPFSLTEIDDFVAFSRSVGAEPLLQIPLIMNTSLETATAQDAAELVTYVNQTQGYGIKYFSIGNEPDLYEEQGLMPAGYAASDFCAAFTEFVREMRSVDPTITIVGPELSWKYQSGANDWLTPFLTECGDAVDIVTVHRYPFSPTACSDTAAYGDAASYRQALAHLRDIMEATGQSEKPLAITEANITWDGEPATSTMVASPGTFPAGLWVADNLGVSLEEGLFTVAYWSLSEGWTLGFFNGTVPRPAYFMLELFSRHFGTQVLTVSGAPADVSAYAGRDDAKGTTSLFVVNKSVNNLAISVTLTDLPRTRGVSFSAPPISLTVTELLDDGSPAQTTTYSADMTSPTVAGG